MDFTIQEGQFQTFVPRSIPDDQLGLGVAKIDPKCSFRPPSATRFAPVLSSLLGFYLVAPRTRRFWGLIGAVALFGADPAEADLWKEIRDGAHVATSFLREWYESYQLGEVNESEVPEMPVQLSGIARLTLHDRVGLAFDEDTPSISTVDWMAFTPEGTLLIIDYQGNQALEFDPTDGEYIRSFGARGNGPGEYGTPRSLAVDPSGQVYLLDSAYGKIIRYSRRGEYLSQTDLFRGSSLVAGRNGEIYSVRLNSRDILEVEQVDPRTWESVFREPVSNSQQRFVSARMIHYSVLRYSPSRHRLYFLGPNDFSVKEIDAETGEILSQFGYRPEKFLPLPERYHGINRGSRLELGELKAKEMSYLESMTILRDQFLLVCHRHPSSSANAWEGIVYDLGTSDPIQAYAFSDTLRGRSIEAHALGHLLGGATALRGEGVSGAMVYRVRHGDIAEWKGFLYVWEEPDRDVVEATNGALFIHEFDLSVHEN